MIEFKNVTKQYDQRGGLKDINIVISDGEFVFIIGESGAGKTTFNKLIQKEIDPDYGKILFDGRDISHLNRREIPAVRQRIGMVFQDFRLLEKKTVYENVAFAMEVLHKSKKEINSRVLNVIDLVGLKNKENKYPHELSAGEQQRVGIARALANNPRVLICDEPTGNLDHKTAIGIMHILESINARGTTVIVATHALDIVKDLNKRVVTIDKGIIISDRIGLPDSDQLFQIDYVDELVKMFGNSDSALSPEERRTIYLTETRTGTSTDDDIERFLGDYLSDNGFDATDN